jgi:anaerobic magnesium-protoporphyrin IX monomethyl ester cyclase
MKYALLNPHWSFEGSIYFGCRKPHLPLEYGYAKSLLERQGHEVLIVGSLGKAAMSGVRLTRWAICIGERYVCRARPMRPIWRPCRRWSGQAT